MADEYINHSSVGHWDIDPAMSGFRELYVDQVGLNWYINRGEITDFDKYHLENSYSCLGALYSICVGSDLLHAIESLSAMSRTYQPRNDRLHHQDLFDYRLWFNWKYIENAATWEWMFDRSRLHTDKKFIQLITWGSYRGLDAGVRIYEYTPGFVWL